MNTEVVTIRGNQFLKIEVVPVYQKHENFYLAKIPARFLLDTFTVVPAKYNVNMETALAAQFHDDVEYLAYRLDENRKRIQSAHFEREEDKSRIAKIKKFLNDNEYALFPNTIIVTCELINDVIGIQSGTKLGEIKDLQVLGGSPF